MSDICNSCWGVVAETVEDYDPFMGCTCLSTQSTGETEETDEEPEECLY